jgi:FkbM family methyltransferase
MTIKQEIKYLLWKIGYDISKFAPTNNPLARRKKIYDYYKIEVILDIGANSGQYARQTRALGYSGKIISFEPLSKAFQLLKTSAKKDTKWDVYNFAIGDSDKENRINISENSYSSSLLEMLPSHLKSSPESKYIGHEEIVVKRIDSIFSDICKSVNGIYMKIDTQGFEKNVINGAEASLGQIDTIQMEMSLVSLYKGELLFPEMCLLMESKGYTLISIEPGFTDQNSGQLLQVDGIFHRT